LGFWLRWQRIHVVEGHVLVLLGDWLRRELAHARHLISLGNEWTHRRPLGEILHVVEGKIIAHLLLRVHVGVVRLAVGHIVHAEWVLLLGLLWRELQVLLDLIEDLPVARLLTLEVVGLMMGLGHLEGLWRLLALVSLPGLVCL
jgi:hypothetical protein